MQQAGHWPSYPGQPLRSSRGTLSRNLYVLALPSLLFGELSTICSLRTKQENKDERVSSVEGFAVFSQPAFHIQMNTIEIKIFDM